MSRGNAITSVILSRAGNIFLQVRSKNCRQKNVLLLRSILGSVILIRRGKDDTKVVQKGDPAKGAPRSLARVMGVPAHSRLSPYLNLGFLTTEMYS